MAAIFVLGFLLGVLAGVELVNFTLSWLKQIEKDIR